MEDCTSSIYRADPVTYQNIQRHISMDDDSYCSETLRSHVEVSIRLAHKDQNKYILHACLEHFHYICFLTANLICSLIISFEKILLPRTYCMDICDSCKLPCRVTKSQMLSLYLKLNIVNY
jgi:hypothetical protein